jgi:hypothetical protein
MKRQILARHTIPYKSLSGSIIAREIPLGIALCDSDVEYNLRIARSNYRSLTDSYTGSL